VKTTSSIMLLDCAPYTPIVVLVITMTVKITVCRAPLTVPHVTPLRAIAIYVTIQAWSS
jgi:hypothetical protein